MQHDVVPSDMFTAEQRALLLKPVVCNCSGAGTERKNNAQATPLRLMRSIVRFWQIPAI
jgi:hypothetical protein